MDKSNREKLIMLCKSIEKEEGVGSIYSLGSKHSCMNIPRFSTCIEDLDYIIGGGIPRGRMLEIFGPESAGKTSLALYLASLVDMCLYLPVEGTFDSSRAKALGNKKGQLIVYNDKYGEDAMEKAMLFAKQGIPLIIIDSVPFLMPKEEYEAVEKDTEKNLRIGGVARLLTKTIPPLTKICEKSGTTIIFINQIRDKLDAMMFGEKTSTPGGHQLKHACSLRIQVGRRSWIEIPNKDPRNSAASEKIGLIIKCKVVKSKICNPYGEAELPMLFDAGFVSHEDMLEARKEKMNENRRRKTKKQDDEEDEE